jgi:hypothetical protein
MNARHSTMHANYDRVFIDGPDNLDTLATP